MVADFLDGDGDGGEEGCVRAGQAVLLKIHLALQHEPRHKPQIVPAQVSDCTDENLNFERQFKLELWRSELQQLTRFKFVGQLASTRTKDNPSIPEVHVWVDNHGTCVGLQESHALRGRELRHWKYFGACA